MCGVSSSLLLAAVADPGVIRPFRSAICSRQTPEREQTAYGKSVGQPPLREFRSTILPRLPVRSARRAWMSSVANSGCWKYGVSLEEGGDETSEGRGRFGDGGGLGAFDGGGRARAAASGRRPSPIAGVADRDAPAAGSRSQ